MSKLRDAWDEIQLSGAETGIIAMEDAITEAEETIARLQKLDAGSAKVESIIALRTHFTGEPPYVGWDGLALALTETLDRLTRERDEAREKSLNEAAEAIEAEITRLTGYGEPNIYMRHHIQGHRNSIDAIRALKGDKP